MFIGTSSAEDSEFKLSQDSHWPAGPNPGPNQRRKPVPLTLLQMMKNLAAMSLSIVMRNWRNHQARKLGPQEARGPCSRKLVPRIKPSGRSWTKFTKHCGMVIIVTLNIV